MPTNASDSSAAPLVHDQHIGRGKQPRHVRDDGDHVEMVVMQQVEAAEREEHRAEERVLATAEPEPPQEPDHTREGRHVVGDQLEIERRPERKQPVEELMQRMEQAGLALAVQDRVRRRSTESTAPVAATAAPPDRGTASAGGTSAGRCRRRPGPRRAAGRSGASSASAAHGDQDGQRAVLAIGLIRRASGTPESARRAGCSASPSCA